MRRALGALLGAVGLLMASPALADRSTKTRVSADGSHGVRLRELEPGRCRLEVVKETSLAWALDRCLGSVDDLYFVSNNGERVWVVVTLPEKPRPNAPKGEWALAVGAREYDRTGRLVSSRSVADLVPGQARGLMRELGKRFKWLEGVAGVPGKVPRISDTNWVEFETVGPATVRLPF